MADHMKPFGTWSTNSLSLLQIFISALIVGLAGEQTQATCVAPNSDNRSAQMDVIPGVK
jgi:hypothetical protein